jgi:hypothetical protein
MQVKAEVRAILATVNLSLGDFRHNAMIAILQAVSPKRYIYKIFSKGLKLFKRIIENLTHFRTRMKQSKSK